MSARKEPYENSFPTAPVGAPEFEFRAARATAPRSNVKGRCPWCLALNHSYIGGDQECSRSCCAAKHGRFSIDWAVFIDGSDFEYPGATLEDVAAGSFGRVFRLKGATARKGMEVVVKVVPPGTERDDEGRRLRQGNRCKALGAEAAVLTYLDRRYEETEPGQLATELETLARKLGSAEVRADTLCPHLESLKTSLKSDLKGGPPPWPRRIKDGWSEPSGLRYLVMERLAGAPLDAIDPRSMGLVAFFQLVTLLADAIKMLHREGLVHGDLKPNNALYSPDTKQLVLVDFGGVGVNAPACSIATPRATNPFTRYRRQQVEEAVKLHKELPGFALDKSWDVYALGKTVAWLRDRLIVAPPADAPRVDREAMHELDQMVEDMTR
jgi:serine/threonine protein kinase